MSVTTTDPPAVGRDRAEEPDTVAVEKHPRAIRWMHWVNFPLLVLMVYSGLRIYWAEDIYRIGLGDWTLFAFFPEWFYQALDLDRHLADGLAWHFFFGWLFVGNGLLYVLFTVVSGEWRELRPESGALRRSWQVLLHDLRLRDRPPPRRGVYNDAQRLTYTGVVLMGAGSVLTGLAIYKPIQLGWLLAAFGGYQPARAIHFVLTLGYVGFFGVHLFQVARAGWGNFWSMITGYERVASEDASALVGDGTLRDGVDDADGEDDR